jgi:DNA repair exonuclease SbcCD nuclease subunit
VDTFSLLHITDLHIATPAQGYFRRKLERVRERKFPSEANPYTLQALAEFVFHHRATLDAVVISGDLAEDGEPTNLQAAHQYITAPAVSGWRASESTFTLHATHSDRPHFFLMPGNHDRFNGLRRLPGGSEFDIIFHDFWSAGIGGIHSLLLPRDKPRLAIIAADFCLQQRADGPVWVGQGYAYRHVIDKLVQETNAVRSTYPDIGVLWISHFPPLSECENSSKLFCASDLLQAAQENGIRFVLAGHLHRNHIYPEVGVEIVCTGTASSLGDGETRGYWIQKLEIEVGKTGELQIDITSYNYKHEDVAFVESHDPLQA